MILTEDTIKKYRANQGYVYLIHAVGTDRYKIGRSINPIARFETLKKQSPYPLQIIECFWTPDAIEDEKELHEYFKSDRVYGEWFTFEGAIQLDNYKGYAGKATVIFADKVFNVAGFSLKPTPIRWVYEIFANCKTIEDFSNAINYLLSTINVACEMIDAGINDSDCLQMAVGASIKSFHLYKLTPEINPLYKQGSRADGGEL